jgi:hypothetical protein
MRNGHVFLKSGLKVKSQNQKKITIKEQSKRLIWSKGILFFEYG